MPRASTGIESSLVFTWDTDEAIAGVVDSGYARPQRAAHEFHALVKRERKVSGPLLTERVE